MTLSFAAVLFRTVQVTDRALAHGFAVALAGWDVPRPSVTVSELRALPGWSVGFYRSGAKALPGGAYEELEHAAELFEDELPPGVAIRDAVLDAASVVYSLVYTDDGFLDDAARFSEGALERHFVRDGEEGLEWGVETFESAEAEPIEIDDDDPEPLLRPHRGSTFLSTELGLPILPALVAALFEDGRRIEVRLFDPGPASIEAAAQRLNRVLRRVDGRGAFSPPETIARVAVSPAYEAFVRTYDFADPSDPRDLYREVAIGAVEGTLWFLREKNLVAKANDPHWASAAAGLFPIAALRSSALGGSGAGERALGLADDGETLSIVSEAGTVRPAGPTFTELLRYLSLGYQERDPVEEDLIGALMLRARIRSSR